MAIQLTIKDSIRENRLFSERAAIAVAIVIILIVVILVRLFYLQISSHEHYATLSDDNRIKVVANPPTRGLLYDRNGVLLAQNLPSFSLELVPEQINDIKGTIQGLQELIELSEGEIERFNKQLKQKRSFKSIPIRYHLSDEEVARFAVNRHRFPGVDIEARLIRDYPLNDLAVHAVGYVGRINEQELQNIDAANYSETHHIGKVGAEKYFEDLLHGTVGLKQVETNVLGRTLRVLNQTPPIPGNDLYLTIDAQLQGVAETALGTNRGALVAINPKNGELLALASMPGYDPNLFVSGIDTHTYNSLQQSLDNPLFNRALQGQYPPGSTVKPFIGLAGLELDTIGINTTSFCPGWFMLKDDDHKYRDWKHEGHGITNLNKAIVQSCDVFFYDLALSLGIDHIHSFLSLFGFGRKLGIDIPGERPGLLPSREWKRTHRHEPWFPGETLITGIGQGFTLSTPLQLASATATLAKRGTFIQPHILYATQGPGDDKHTVIQAPPGNKLPVVKQKNWDLIIQSMVDVVSSVRGTAHNISKKTAYNIAGKTGTAQVFGIKQDEKYVKEEVTARLRDHALFIAFAPVDDPTIAVAVIVENGGSGGSVAAPIAREVIDNYLMK